MDGNIFVVHNGTIDDVNNHREFLKSKGINLKSETDTELIA
jgi:glucosamine 6-phosphate synthetase-like amidotransferase/phosphosugar isomerase protein